MGWKRIDGRVGQYYWLPIPLAMVVTIFMLQGCGSEREVQVRASPKPTTPKPTFKQEGEASWYGPGFHGKETASGDTFNQNKMTAAHRTLPLGTKAKVTNPETGKSVTVTVNDRGPYVKGRDIDLSHAAAKKLGIKKGGVETVNIEATPSRRSARQASDKRANTNHNDVP